MVAAVVIPIIFLYFLIITVKERKRRYEEYLKLDTIKEESLLTGQVSQIRTKRKNYIDKHSVYVTTLIIIDERLRRVKATRISNTSLPVPIRERDQIICYGLWDKDHFTFIRYKIEKNINNL